MYKVIGITVATQAFASSTRNKIANAQREVTAIKVAGPNSGIELKYIDRQIYAIPAFFHFTRIDGRSWWLRFIALPARQAAI